LYFNFEMVVYYPIYNFSISLWFVYFLVEGSTVVHIFGFWIQSHRCFQNILPVQDIDLLKCTILGWVHCLDMDIFDFVSLAWKPLLKINIIYTFIFNIIRSIGNQISHSVEYITSYQTTSRCATIRPLLLALSGILTLSPVGALGTLITWSNIVSLLTPTLSRWWL